MSNVITFTRKPRTRRDPSRDPAETSVVSLEDWRRVPHPIRTPSGVFFVTNVWGSRGDAA